MAASHAAWSLTVPVTIHHRGRDSGLANPRKSRIGQTSAASPFACDSREFDGNSKQPPPRIKLIVGTDPSHHWSQVKGHLFLAASLFPSSSSPVSPITCMTASTCQKCLVFSDRRCLFLSQLCLLWSYYLLLILID